MERLLLACVINQSFVGGVGGPKSSLTSMVLIYACCSGVIVKRDFTLTRVLGWAVSYMVILGPSQDHFLPGGLSGKECLQCRRPGFDPWVGKIPRRRAWQPTPVFLPGESHRQRSLADCSPWSCGELDII